VEHREEPERVDDAVDDDQILSEEVDDDEAADIKRLRDTRSKIEGGTILNGAVSAGSMSEETSSPGQTQRQGKKIGL
jgi:hypothetical protein